MNHKYIIGKSGFSQLDKQIAASIIKYNQEKAALVKPTNITPKKKKKQKMKLTTNKHTKQFADKHRVPEWRVVKVMFELDTQDSELLDNYFNTHTFEDKIKEMNVRVNEISLYLQQSRTISKEEWFPINIRIGHLKEDTKNFAEEFSYIKPNIIGKIKSFVSEQIDLLLNKNLSIEDFVTKLDLIIQDGGKMAKEDSTES